MQNIFALLYKHVKLYAEYTVSDCDLCVLCFMLLKMKMRHQAMMQMNTICNHKKHIFI